MDAGLISFHRRGTSLSVMCSRERSPATLLRPRSVRIWVPSAGAGSIGKRVSATLTGTFRIGVASRPARLTRTRRTQRRLAFEPVVLIDRHQLAGPFDH